MLRVLFTLLISYLSAFAYSNEMVNVTDPTVWLVESGLVRVTLSDCGNGTPCGTISWVSSDNSSQVDHRNPDDKLRDRKLVGVTMLWGFEAHDEAWVGGQIYNPKNGKTYRSKLRLTSNETLIVEGCIGPFCKKQYWTKVGSKQ